MLNKIYQQYLGEDIGFKNFVIMAFCLCTASFIVTPAFGIPIGIILYYMIVSDKEK